MVSAIERCPLFLSAIKRFFYETMTMIPSVLMNSVRYREMFAIKHVRFREVPLYCDRLIQHVWVANAIYQYFDSYQYILWFLYLTFLIEFFSGDTKSPICDICNVNKVKQCTWHANFLFFNLPMSASY